MIKQLLKLIEIKFKKHNTNSFLINIQKISTANRFNLLTTYK